MNEAQKVYINNKGSQINFGIREKTLISIGVFTIFLGSIIIFGSLITEEQISINLLNKNQSPSLEYLFGTDWVGRNMLYRTIKGLSLSMKIGLLSSVISGVIALTLGVIGATLGSKVDSFISWFIDLVTRVIRAEVMQIKQSDYAKISRNFGKSNLYIATHHILPHIIPQLLVGIVLVFPHAVLHEASITFLGFGLPPHEPAIGIILSESMKYLSSGRWWLSFFPGLSLVIVSLMVDNIGKKFSQLINPKTAYK